MLDRAGSSIADLDRRAAVIATWFLAALLAPASCSSADTRPCPQEVTVTQLCVVARNGATAIDRLAAKNLVDPTQDVRPDPENAQRGLAEVRVDKDTPLTVAIGPSEGLLLIEFDVYASKTRLAEDIPVVSVECDHRGCSRWPRSYTRNGQTIRIPPADLKSGHVVIVRAFVHRAHESGTVSWGLLINSD